MARKVIAAVTVGLSVLVSLASQSGSTAAEATPRKVVFSEGFEGDGKMRPWASNGPYKVNFAGPTEDRAASGKRSFKIDITWTDCTYNYWQSAPLMIPYYGNPKVSGKLYVERGNAEIGYSSANPKTETYGNVSRGVMLRRRPDGWSEWTAGGSSRPDSARHIQAVVVYLKPDKEKRTIVYVDDLQVEAVLPEDYQPKLKSQIAEIVAERRAFILKETDKLQAGFAELVGQMDKVPAKLPSSTSSVLAECWQQRCENCRQLRSKLETHITQLQTAPRSSTLNSARRWLRLLGKAYATSGSFLKYAETHAALPYMVWVVKPISNEHILPDNLPIYSAPGTELRISACAGEYEPASFAIYAPKGLNEVIARPTDAKCGDRTIPASAIDVHIVKCWWQAGVGIGDTRHPTFTPELLLKDPNVVRADNDKKRNVLRNPKAPQDARKLQPVSMPAGTTQQFWATVRVPDNAQPGTYRGTIRLEAKDAQPLDLGLTIEVLPFRLEEPLLEYSIYYRGRLTPDGKGSIGAEIKSETQYLAEMRNLKAHGVTHPICYQAFGKLLDRAIELRKQAGIVVDPFYSLGASTGAPQSPEALAALKQRIRSCRDQLGKHGIKELYVYGIDEVKGERLKAERKAFNAVHEAGAKVFVACNVGTFESVGNLLDLPIYAILVPDEAKKWHDAGCRIFSYNNPQVGVEQPETYRRNFGLALWKAGYDGACNYAYQHGMGDVQHGFGDIWDDFDCRAFRDHNFTYPTVDGVIDTIQWEGFREGVDDVRYLTTLLKMIEQAKSNQAKRQIAAEAAKWVEAMDVTGDLDVLRAKIVEWIVRLSN